MATNTPEYRREYQREWIKKNKEKLAARRKAWREANYERVRAAELASRQRNIEQHRAASRERMRKARSERPEHFKEIARRSAIKLKYRKTQEEIDALFISQGSRCAICGADHNGGKRWHIDHCHFTGRVRGILCQHCNLMLGHAKDDVSRLRAAATYLEASKEAQQ